MNKIQGEKIYLRGFEMRDKDAVFAGVNEPVSAKLTGTHGDGFTMALVEKYIEMNIAGDERFTWLICLSDDTPVGEVIINEIDEDNRSANIRIGLFDPQYFGKGYGTEAMKLAVDYGFKHGNLHRIELSVYDFNPRAIHVYEKVGFTLEGTLRDSLLWDGEYTDEHIMSRKSVV